MATKPIIPIPELKPVPRRSLKSTHRGRARRKKLKGIHHAKPGNICLYVIGPDSDCISKVGVSEAPYARLTELEYGIQLSLNVFFFVEIPRADGFKVEALFHENCRRMGHTYKGEWIASPRAGLTSELKRIVKEVGSVGSFEVGNTLDDRKSDGDHLISGQFERSSVELGVTPQKG